MQPRTRSGSSPPTSCLRCRRRLPARLVAPRRARPILEPSESVEPGESVSSAGGSTYLDRLAARSAATGTVLCLGLDPVPTALPKGFSPDVAGVERFVQLVVEAALPFAAA